MTFVVYRSQTSASLRRIPIWLVGSNGTSPATGESGGQPQINWIPRGTATVNTTNNLSLVSANAGEYYVELTASEVSALGAAKIHYRSGSAIANAIPFEITNYDSGDSVDLGLTAFSEVTLHAGTHSSATVQGLSNYANISNVTLHEGTHSGATIQGIGNDSVMTIAGVTNTATLIGALNDIDGSGVTLHAGTHSSATIKGIENYANISNVTIMGSIVTLNSNVRQVHDDASAAANLELAFDGTGYDSKLTTLSAAGATPASVAVAVWDEVMSDHSTEDSYGAALRVASAGSRTQATASTSEMTLGSGETTVDDWFNGHFINFLYADGSMAGEIIDDYKGSSKTVVLRNALPLAPSSTSYIISAMPSAGTANVDVIAVSGDVAAADNLELAFDGTGYDSKLTTLTAGAGGFDASTDTVIVGESNITVNVNVRQVHDDATAAANLESAFDGTGYDSKLTTLTAGSGGFDASTDTVIIGDINAGAYSGVSIQGITNASVLTIAGVTNTATLIGALNDIDGSGVTLHAGTHSNVTIKGLENYANLPNVDLNADQTDVSIGTVVNAVSSSFDPSTDTVKVGDIDAGSYSGVSIQGITNASVLTIAGVTNTATLIGALNDIDGSGVTLHAGSHSGATIDGVEVTTVNTDMVGTDGAMLAGSTVTLSDGGLTSAKFGVGAVDAAALATDAGQEIADRVLLRSVVGGKDSGRSVGQAMSALRNRVESDATQIYVYLENDSTIMWKASLVTVASTNDHISGVNPD